MRLKLKRESQSIKEVHVHSEIFRGSWTKFMNLSMKKGYLWVASSSKTQFFYVHNWRPGLRQVKIRRDLFCL